MNELNLNGAKQLNLFSICVDRRRIETVIYHFECEFFHSQAKMHFGNCLLYTHIDQKEEKKNAKTIIIIEGKSSTYALNQR